ncbi:MAG: hypothetical protein HY286_12700 [Planctomycetes bacterium]|nr:hypothetical protein [Planctomycetota bacterium]
MTQLSTSPRTRIGGAIVTSAVVSAIALFALSCHRTTSGFFAAGGGAGGGAAGTIQNGGSTVEVTKPTSPIFGGKVVGAPGSVDVGETITLKMRPEKDLPAPLPAGFVALGPSVDITKNSGYNFLIPVTATLPYNAALLQAGDEPLAIYWDEVYGQWLPCGTISIDEVGHFISFSTIHCTSFIIVGAPGVTSALPSVDTGFVAGVDSMFHPNFGAYDNPGGSSIGIVLFADWYFKFKKASDGNALHDKYRQGDPNLFKDDVVAKELINRVFIASSQIWAAIWGMGSCPATSPTTGLEIINAMAISNMPQVMMIRGTAASGKKFASAVLVYKFDAGTGKFSIYDPNFPTEVVTLNYSTGSGFSNYSKAPAYPGTIDEYCYDALSSYLYPSQFEQYYDAAEQAFTNAGPSTSTSNIANTITFITIDVIAPLLDANDVATITDFNTPVTVSGHANSGAIKPKTLAYYINGGMKHKTPIDASGNFTFDIQQVDLPNAINALMMIATEDPRQEWNSHSGFRYISIKKQGVGFFSNLGFESCDFTSWTHESHTWQNSTPGSFNPEKSAIVNAGTDPIATTLQLPYAGTCCCRVNNSDNNYHISSVSQTAAVPNVANPQLQFYWAAVLEDPNHAPQDQPYMDIVVTDDTSSAILYQKHFFSNDPTYSGWIPFNGGSWKAIDWQVVFIDVTGAQGHSVTIKVTGADCALGGHGGYTYVDGDDTGVISAPPSIVTK